MARKKCISPPISICLLVYAEYLKGDILLEFADFLLIQICIICICRTEGGTVGKEYQKRSRAPLHCFTNFTFAC